MLAPRTAPVQRLSAFAIDWCVFALWAGLLTIVAFVSQGGDPAWPSDPWLGQALGFTFATLPFGLYLALMEGSRWQATLGKRALALQVTTRHRPTRSRTLGRAAVKLLPWEVGHMAPYQLIALDDAGAATPSWLVAAIALCSAVPLWFVTSLWSASGRTPYVESPARASRASPRHGFGDMRHAAPPNAFPQSGPHERTLAAHVTSRGESRRTRAHPLGRLSNPSGSGSEQRRTNGVLG